MLLNLYYNTPVHVHVVTRNLQKNVGRLKKSSMICGSTFSLMMLWLCQSEQEVHALHISSTISNEASSIYYTCTCKFGIYSSHLITTSNNTCTSIKSVDQAKNRRYSTKWTSAIGLCIFSDLLTSCAIFSSSSE